LLPFIYQLHTPPIINGQFNHHVVDISLAKSALLAQQTPGSGHFGHALYHTNIKPWPSRQEHAKPGPTFHILNPGYNKKPNDAKQLAVLL
jgi:hypothetical protein